MKQKKDFKEYASHTHYPSPLRDDAFSVSDEKKIQLIEEKITDILHILGLDLENESIKNTPSRVARMYVQEIFSGLDPKNFPSIALHPERLSSDEMILVKNVYLISFCEHHLVPFEGKAHVAYLPGKEIIGLSKINRIVQYFAKRPQLQERLTAQIADSLSTILNTENIAVSITAKHFCVAARGIKDHVSETTTHVLRGKFQTCPMRRSEFLTSINH